MDSLNRIATIASLVILVIALQGCKSKSRSALPPMPPTSSPPTSSVPPALPGETGRTTKAPSSRSDKQKKDSRTSPGSSSEEPQVALPSPGLPGKSSSQPRKTDKRSRQEAGKTLRESGERIAKSGQDLENQLPDDEVDPLAPEGDKNSDGLFVEGVLTDENATSGKPMSDELRRVLEELQEAMEEAGISLQEAGEAIENANTDEEIGTGRDLLAKARLQVIIAGQDLADIQDLIETDDSLPSIPDLDHAEDILDDANVAIVVASQSVLDLGIDLPDFQLPGSGMPDSNGRNPHAESKGDLDKELDESIAIFEAEILEARNDVIGSTPPPRDADSIPGVAVLGGSKESDGAFSENPLEGPDDALEIDTGNMPEPKDVALAEDIPQLVPDDIPSPQGDDIVAQQLREAATAEKDPDLREKLWDEYRKYRAAL